ncbi:MAG: hypothetical protein ACRC6X_04875, partial [Culicoidibacterales bacterium]
AGVEIITYTSTDTDGNVTTADRTYVIESETEKATIGTNYVIFTSNFTKHISAVVVTNQAVITEANARAFLLKDASVAAVEVTDLAGYKAVVGAYDIEYGVVSESTTKKKAIGTVVVGMPPTIELTPPVVKVSVGDKVDTQVGVVANDLEDGMLVSTPSSQVDTTKIGVQIITYTAIDSDGNSVSTNRSYVIESETEKATIGINYVIFASNFVKLIDKVVVSDLAVITEANARAFSLKDGSSLEVEVLNRGGYAAIVGTYPIEYAVKEEKTTTIKITGKVIKNGEKPKITGDKSPIKISIGEDPNPIQGIIGSDFEDGDLKVIYDKEIDTTKRGVQIITYKVIDSDGNTAEAERTYIITSPDDKLMIGENYVIVAEDFTKMIKDVDTADEAVIESSKAEAFSLDDETKVAVSIVNRGQYGPKVGVYPITFNILAEPETEMIIYATVKAEQENSGKAQIIVTHKELTYIKNTEKTEQGFIEDAGIRLINAINLKTDFKQAVDMSKVGRYLVSSTATENIVRQLSMDSTQDVNTLQLIEGEKVIVNVIEYQNSDKHELPKTGESIVEKSMQSTLLLAMAGTLVLLGRKLKRNNR